MKKIAFVTGANKGIGFEISRQLIEEGIFVLLGCRDIEKGKRAEKLLNKKSESSKCIHIDTEKSLTIQAAATYITKNYSSLDILINNAGVLLEAPVGEFGFNTTLDISPSVLQQTFQMNYFGHVEITQALIPMLKKSSGATIINMSSILGSVAMHANPKSPIYSSKCLGYNSSKAALNVFTTHLQYTLQDTRIKTYSVHPGWVQTDMTAGSAAPMHVKDGAKTAVDIALGKCVHPSGSYVHLDKLIPW